MKRFVISGFCVLLMATSAAFADVKVDVGHNNSDDATAAFNFKEVPSPAKTNAATNAKITIVDGDQDGHGAGVEALNDGKLPTEQDDPAANFFFNAGTDGGRILIDLGSVINVRQVNTYSWHTDERAPQVYSLYAADGTAAGFNAKPTKDIDPTTAGWTLIAKVDTRPKTGESGGGQYGVSVSDTKGNLGKFRYVLIAASKTESDNGFGNTFYSEINVIDANAPVVAPSTQAAPANTGVSTFTTADGKYKITLDVSASPEMKDWADQLKPIIEKWYPIIAADLPSDGFTEPKNFAIKFKPMTGVAYTVGTQITCATYYFKQHADDQGAVVHEMVHVVQHYRGGNNPIWLVEGMADYIRWFQYEPASKRPHPNPAKANYNDSYRTSAAFLDWVVRTYDKNLIVKLNAACRAGKYSDDLWKQYTGKAVADLGQEWKESLSKK